MIKAFEEISDSSDRRRESYHQLYDWIIGFAEKQNANRKSCAFSKKSSFDEYRKKVREDIGSAIGFDRLPVAKGTKMLEHVQIYEDADRTYTRIKLQIYENLDLYGILAEPSVKGDELVICCHGYLGTPEHICGIVDAANYNDAVDKLLAEGLTVFLPQLVLLRDETDEGWPESYRSDMHINGLWAGITPAAIEIMKIGAATRYLKQMLGLKRAGICGLSYGGFYALFSCALLDELEWCICSCYFNDRFEILKVLEDGGRDWLFPGAAGSWGDAEVAALICPRPLYVEVALHDEVLPSESARREADRALAYYRSAECEERFLFDVFEGVHEFSLRKLEVFLERRALCL